jgi:hypothetical protein
MKPYSFRIWVTSVEHLYRFRGLLECTAPQDRLRGCYQLPPDFPRIRGSVFGPLRRPLPAVLLSSGDLHVADGHLTFAPLAPRFARYDCLIDCALSLPFQSLRSVSLFKLDYAAFRAFDLPFIRLNALIPAIPGTPLVCASGNGPFALGIRRRTERLFVALQAVANSSAA